MIRLKPDFDLIRRVATSTATRLTMNDIHGINNMITCYLSSFRYLLKSDREQIRRIEFTLRLISAGFSVKEARTWFYYRNHIKLWSEYLFSEDSSIREKSRRNIEIAERNISIIRNRWVRDYRIRRKVSYG